MNYVSRQEVEAHWQRVRRYMQCDALLLAQTADRFYLTGTSEDGILWFPREGEPTLLVRKSFERAKVESPLKNIQPFKKYSEIPSLIGKPGETLGFELDVLPAATYQQLTRMFPNSRSVDASMTLRWARSVKTPYEIDQIRHAANILDKAFEDIPSQLREGIAEYELAAHIEYVMRMAGHQGLIRVRRFNMTLHYGFVSFGDSAAYPHSFDGPVGARGLYPGSPPMAGWKRLQRGEPVMVDVCGGYGGYISDGSRTFALRSLPQEIKDTHSFALEVNSCIEDALRPGKIPSQIYAEVIGRVAKTSYAPYFMGARENQVNFVAHGIGLELDEFPVIAPRFDEPLEVNTVLAVEPKIFYPGRGGAGIENTYVIREHGAERLTLSPLNIVYG